MPSHAPTEQALVLYLLRHPGPVTADEVATHFGVSTKTIYRSIQRINPPHGPEVISTHRGRGLQLDHDAWLTVQHAERTAAPTLRPSDRRRRILKDLLDEAPAGVIVFELCARYGISEPQLRADAKLIRESLHSHELTLRHADYELAIVGAETGIRSALSQALQVRTLDRLTFADQDLHSEDRRAMDFARTQVTLVGDLLGGQLPSPYDVNLATHLFVLMSRRRHPNATAAGAAEPDLRHGAAVDARLWRVAEVVHRNVEDFLGTPVPAVEVDYVYAHLASSHLMAPSQAADHEDLATRFSLRLAEMMAFHRGVHFTASRLVGDLAKHVRPLLNRLRYGLSVDNPVLDQIRESYPELLVELSAAVAEVAREFELPAVSPEEVGYMALYFARELELRATTVRVLLACASGIGTAELLRVKLSRAFPEIEVVEVVSAGLVPQVLADQSAIDLVISTVSVAAGTGVPVILVDAMFSSQSQDRVRKALRHVS